MSTNLHYPSTRFSISPEMALLPYRNITIPHLDRRDKQDRTTSTFSAPPVVSSFGLLSLLGLAACSGSDNVSLPAGALEVTGASLSETPTITSVPDDEGNVAAVSVAVNSLQVQVETNQGTLDSGTAEIPQAEVASQVANSVAAEIAEQAGFQVTTADNDVIAVAALQPSLTNDDADQAMGRTVQANVVQPADADSWQRQTAVPARSLFIRTDRARSVPCGWSRTA